MFKAQIAEMSRVGYEGFLCEQLVQKVSDVSHVARVVQYTVEDVPESEVTPCGVDAEAIDLILLTISGSARHLFVADMAAMGR